MTPDEDRADDDHILPNSEFVNSLQCNPTHYSVIQLFTVELVMI